MSWEGLVMTLNKSLFNSGIFKNTVYRFKWGSFLYFVALFFCVPFMLLVADFKNLAEQVIGSSYYMSSEVLLRNDFLIAPMLLAIAVPTVVAVLVFNNVHSAKQGVFVHSLPCDRRTSYISNLAAAFVLMGVPVIANGIILMLMSFGKFGQIMSSMSVLYWIGLNLNMLFVMFSIAVFAAFLTGNIGAHIVINIFLHLIPVIIGWAIVLISEQFLYGYYQTDNFVANELVLNNPVVWILMNSTSNSKIFAMLQTWGYIIGAAGVYALSYLLYQRRKIEACGDVAAFRVFKPLLKYSVTTGAAIALFGILTSMETGAAAMFAVVLVLCAIVYFAAEMLMSKNFKVFKTSYKGFCGFVACCVVFIGFFAYTSVFGYETRVPKLENIQRASVVAGRHDAVFEDAQIIEDTLNIHKEIIADIPVVEDRESDYRRLLVSYELKNGKKMQRDYKTSPEIFDKAMDKMYQSKEYKLNITQIDNVNIENIDNLILSAEGANYSYNIALNSDAPLLLKAIKEDVEQLSYEEMQTVGNSIYLSVSIDCTVEENEKLKYFKDTGDIAGGRDPKYSVYGFGMGLNGNYKNTYAFLKEKGYYDQIISELAEGLVICKEPMYKAGEICTYKGVTGRFEEFVISQNDCKQLDTADGRLLANELATTKQRDIPEGETYMIFTRQNLGNELYAVSYAAVLKAEEMPEYIKKYIEE